MAEKLVWRGKAWYYRLTLADGRRVMRKACTDRRESERMQAQAELDEAKIRAGLVARKDLGYRDAESIPLADHIDAYGANLRDRNRTEAHVVLTLSRARRIVALCRGAKLADIERANSSAAELARADRALADAIAFTRLSDLTTEAVQSALAILREAGRSLTTCNHHATAIRGFATWCYETHRLKEDPLRGIERFNAAEDRRHDRRTISLEELRRLIVVAEQGPTYVQMTGPMRALCYRLAVATGLRFSELASIRPTSFHWPARTVSVQAGYTKNRAPASFTLPDDLVDDLRAYVEALGPDSPIFPMPRRGRGAEMLRVDLAAAGIPYRDEAGLVFDFHSLRCEMATLADAAGVTPRVVQRMMRHSTLELTGRYTKPRAVDIEAAASMLPPLKPDPPAPESVRLAATGTDGTHQEPSDPSLIRRQTATGQSESHPDMTAHSADSAAPVPETKEIIAMDASVRLVSHSDEGIPKVGLEPTRVLPHRILSPAPKPREAGTGSRESPNQPPLAPPLLHDTCQTDPELARIMDAWPALPPTVRASILMLVDAATPSPSQEGGNGPRPSRPKRTRGPKR